MSMQVAKLVRGSTALVAVATLTIAGCSSSGSSGDKAAKKGTTTTTTAAKDGGSTTSTTAAEVDHPSDELKAAFDAWDQAAQAAGGERNDAVANKDLDAAKAAIAKTRTAYFDFDKALRDLQPSGADADRVNEMLLVDGDVIANLDEYAAITDPSRYNDILYKEDASVNEWRKLMRSLTDDWEVDATIPPDADLPEGYVGAGDRIKGASSAVVDFSVEVPDGFAGEDEFISAPDLRGPKTAYVSGGIANTQDTDPKPKTDADLKSYVDDYAGRVVDKAEGQLTDPATEVDAGEAGKAYAYTFTSDGGVERDVLFRTPDGTVVEISLSADDKDEFARFEDRFAAMIQSIEIGG
jgi:hypothetical protein